MKIDVLCAILDKIDSSPTTPVEVHVDVNNSGSGYYEIISVTAIPEQPLSDRRIIINVGRNVYHEDYAIE